MANYVNLLKLSVGSETIQDLAAWHDRLRQRTTDGYSYHITRMWPRREADVLAGGSIYWVVKGAVLARQRILRFDPIDRGDGITRCKIVLAPDLIRTEVVPKRPFQGWRYLDPKDAPRDLPDGRAAEQDALPPQLLSALADIGVR